ncbi:MAG: type II toxin-antitoxin system RelE/ParE family toxin [Planctomycetota bacterium]
MATSRRKFEYHPDAIADAKEAIAWYAERNPEAAEKFKSELRHAEDQVTMMPELYQQFMFGTKRCLLATFPFSLVFVERGDKIYGLAVAHSSRKPGYWKQHTRY